MGFIPFRFLSALISWRQKESGTTSGMWGRLTLPYQILRQPALPMEASPLTRLCAPSSVMHVGASVFTWGSQESKLGPFIKT